MSDTGVGTDVNPLSTFTMTPLVSIVIPHFQTPQLAKLCLRSIRRFTYDIDYEVIVVDNASRGIESKRYLRSVDWIHLIERTGDIATGGTTDLEALAIGFEAAQAPFVMTIHTDTIPIHRDWLRFHLNPMLANQHIAAIGTDKPVVPSRFQAWLNFAVDAANTWNRIRRTPDIKKLPYILSHCALYRRSTMDEYNLKYDTHLRLAAGQGLYLDLKGLGCECRLVDPYDVAKRVVHLNLATELPLHELQSENWQVPMWRGQTQIRRFLQQPEIQAILEDDSLDHGVEFRQRAA